MRSRSWFILFVVVLTACDDTRVYEIDREFKDRIWKAVDTARFEFAITDIRQPYNICYNIRNSMEYPWSRLFVQYSLLDPGGAEIQTKLASAFLFDQKTGKPFGTSGLGDVYDHRVPILTNFEFKRAGVYKIKLAQFMRLDSLKGILAVGIRVETIRK